jgi:hypothetical protein
MLERNRQETPVSNRNEVAPTTFTRNVVRHVHKFHFCPGGVAVVGGEREGLLGGKWTMADALRRRFLGLFSSRAGRNSVVIAPSSFSSCACDRVWFSHPRVRFRFVVTLQASLLCEPSRFHPPGVVSFGGKGFESFCRVGCGVNTPGRRRRRGSPGGVRGAGETLPCGGAGGGVGGLCCSGVRCGEGSLYDWFLMSRAVSSQGGPFPPLRNQRGQKVTKGQARCQTGTQGGGPAGARSRCSFLKLRRSRPLGASVLKRGVVPRPCGRAGLESPRGAGDGPDGKSSGLGRLSED